MAYKLPLDIPTRCDIAAASASSLLSWARSSFEADTLRLCAAASFMPVKCEAGTGDRMVPVSLSSLTTVFRPLRWTTFCSVETTSAFEIRASGLLGVRVGLAMGIGSGVGDCNPSVSRLIPCTAVGNIEQKHTSLTFRTGLIRGSTQKQIHRLSLTTTLNRLSRNLNICTWERTCTRSAASRTLRSLS